MSIRLCDKSVEFHAEQSLPCVIKLTHEDNEVFLEKVLSISHCVVFFFFQAEDGIRDYKVTGVQTCALPISSSFVTSHMNPAAPGISAIRSLASSPSRSF